METGLQQAEEVFQSALADEPIDNQQQMESDTVEEVEAEQEATEPEFTEQEEPEEVTEQESPTDKYYPIKLDGEDMEITLDEALQGYQRQSDYTKKTQVLANDRKQVETEKQALAQQREQYKQNVDRLVLERESQTVQEPDWDQLYETDPLLWMKQKEELRTNKERSLELQQEQYRLQQENQQEQNAQMQQFISSQHETLLVAIPEWKDQKVMAREKIEIKQYALGIGYSAQEIDQVYDSRAVLALRAGMKASGLSGKGASKLKPKQSPIRSAAPGSISQRPQSKTSVSKAKIQLAKSGKMSDAENIFKHLL